MGNSVAEVIQDSPLGQVIRFISHNKFFTFPEDDPNFKIPWEIASASEKEKEIEVSQHASRTSSINITPEIFQTPQSLATREDVEAHGLSTIPTSHSAARSHIGVVTTRTITRERTLPYSRERFEVEQAEAIERKQSSVIAPQRTADGVILVDWYTTDDPANPQNWNSWKKAWVAAVIWMYTFVVYCASAIYTSAEPQIMEKFGVGTSKAALGLSMYVLGYGTGPMVCVACLPLFSWLALRHILNQLKLTDAY